MFKSFDKRKTCSDKWFANKFSNLIVKLGFFVFYLNWVQSSENSFSKVINFFVTDFAAVLEPVFEALSYSFNL